MADSARETIVEAIVSALNGGSKPAGLTVHRFRAKPIQRDTLPAMAVYARHEDVQHVAPNGVPAMKRELLVAIECRVQGDEPDEALDPYVQWTTEALLADPTLGGVCRGMEEVSTDWDAAAEDKVYGAAAVVFRVWYYTDKVQTTRIG